MSFNKYTIRDPEKRFWSKVNKNGSIPQHCPELGNCWEWTGVKFHSSGYGQFSYKLKTVSSHRYSWYLAYGEIPEGLFVLHKCDNKICCNPNHLFLGTQKDNSDDKVSKQRHTKGNNHGMSKLTENQVFEIRRLWNTGKYYQREIGEMFDVSQTAISNILLRKTWKG